MNTITEKTTKEEVRKVYKNYPDTAPEGFMPFHGSRVNPIFWDIPDNVSVLDIGCNSGEFLKRLVDGRKGIKAKGVDISENVVKIAREKGLGS
jgi:2-polyprenyl-3-methyl-5-hydroxy-6-metoxy-1,4-benzoquinol methylase